MKKSRILELLECERQCILRNSLESCNRDCANCDLLQDSEALLTMYDLVKRIVDNHEQRVIGRWKQLKGDFTTPGGTPYYAVNYLNQEREEKIYVITCFSDKDKFLSRVAVD